MDKNSPYYTDSCIELEDLHVGQKYHVINGLWSFTVVAKTENSLIVKINDVHERHTLKLPFDAVLFVVTC